MKGRALVAYQGKYELRHTRVSRKQTLGNKRVPWKLFVVVCVSCRVKLWSLIQERATTSIEFSVC